MAEATLNFDETTLDTSSDLYHLYDRLYQGMVKANEVDPPAFPSSDDLLVKDSNGQIAFDSDGNPIFDSVKTALVEQMSAAYSDILLKNSAYLFANAIMSVMSGGTGSGGNQSATRFVSRAGDSMQGAFSAWYGFDAGVNGQKIFEVSIDANEKKWANIFGNLKVAEDAEVSGLVKLGQGVAFDGNKAIYIDNGALNFDWQDLKFKGNVEVDSGSFTLGNVKIDQSGIFWNNLEFYHSGNANKPEIDWVMNDAEINGNLLTKGDGTINGMLAVKDGFSFSVNTEDGIQKLLYSEAISELDENCNLKEKIVTILNSDFQIINGHGIKFNQDYIVRVRDLDTVSFAAPGMTLNLGDSDGNKLTSKISLQSDIWDYSSVYKIISKEGAGNFPNGLRAQCAVSASMVLETFYIDKNNLGVLFNKQLRLGELNGPIIFSDTNNGSLNIELPFTYFSNGDTKTENIGLWMYYAPTTSLFKNQALDTSATLHLSTDGEFIAFDNPVEANFFSIKSEQYHTRLIEDALFFDDGKFIEGVSDGLRFSGNGYFYGNISSPSFASGFAGYGWAIKDEVTHGGFHATFDSITIRKKMRVYELEVQKTSCTNGSLWVSDSCSGDEVIMMD